MIESIKRKTDILEVVGRYVRLEKKGNRWWGLSPFKTEKTPSFTVQPDQGFFYCFATQKGGDVITFTMEMEKLTYPEALRYLAEQAGIAVDDSPPDPQEAVRSSLLELNSRTTRTFQYLLTSDKRGAGAIEYLRSRGIPDEIVTAFRLGYAPDEGKWLYQFLRSKSYSAEFLAESGLFSRDHPEYSMFRNRLIFPIMDERDSIRAFGGRALQPNDRAKYLNSPDTAVYQKKRTLFGLSQAVKPARERNVMVVCEGYMDVLALHMAGVTNAVAPLGTAFTPEQAQLLKRWVETLVFVFDSDDAGEAATFKAALVAEKAGFSAKAARLPKGEDPADVLRSRGPESLWNAVEKSVGMFEFLVDLSIDRENSSDARGRELVLRKLLPYISITSSEVRRESYLDRVADRLGLSSSSVRSDFDRWKQGGPQETGNTQTGRKLQISMDLHLLIAVVEHGELFSCLRNRITSDDLDDPDARTIFLVLEDAFRHGEVRTENVLEGIQDENLKTILLQKIASGEYDTFSRAGLDQAVNRIRERILSNSQRELESRLRRSSKEDDLTLLLQEKMAVDEELSTLKVRANDGTAE